MKPAIVFKSKKNTKYKTDEGDVFEGIIEKAITDWD